MGWGGGGWWWVVGSGGGGGCPPDLGAGSGGVQVVQGITHHQLLTSYTLKINRPSSLNNLLTGKRAETVFVSLDF